MLFSPPRMRDVGGAEEGSKPMPVGDGEATGEPCTGWDGPGAVKRSAAGRRSKVENKAGSVPGEVAPDGLDPAAGAALAAELPLSIGSNCGIASKLRSIERRFECFELDSARAAAALACICTARRWFGDKLASLSGRLNELEALPAGSGAEEASAASMAAMAAANCGGRPSTGSGVRSREGEVGEAGKPVLSHRLLSLLRPTCPHHPNPTTRVVVAPWTSARRYR